MWEETVVGSCDDFQRLGESGDTRAVEPLIMALGNSREYERQHAAMALDKLGESIWKEIIVGSDDDFQRLGESEDPRAVEPLIHALDGRSGAVRKAAALVLLKKAKEDPEIRLSCAAVQKIREPHSDSIEYRSSDCNRHTDTGIGVEVTDF
jgi:HEAT repeat protein